MIKILLPDSTKGRNKAAFRYFKQYAGVFQAMGIEFTSYGSSYDFVFLGNENFQLRKGSLEASIQFGVDNVNKYNKPVYLIDATDSTSLVGAYEVLKRSRARYLFKNQLLNRDDYKIPTYLGKWWWAGKDNTFSYDIPDDMWNRIKLTGWNLGYHSPTYHEFVDTKVDRDIDVCAIWKTNHDTSSDFEIRNDVKYEAHRSAPYLILENSKYEIAKGTLPYLEYIDVLKRSKVAISPYGMGEVCFRDFEYMQYGIPIIKPTMSNVNTIPDFYMDGKTYIQCKFDYSDLNEVLDEVLGNYDAYKAIAENARLRFRRRYQTSLLVEHWYKFIKMEPGVSLSNFAQ
mgnify:CR=1 FL=1